MVRSTGERFYFVKIVLFDHLWVVFNSIMRQHLSQCCELRVQFPLFNVFICFSNFSCWPTLYRSKVYFRHKNMHKCESNWQRNIQPKQHFPIGSNHIYTYRSNVRWVVFCPKFISIFLTFWYDCPITVTSSCTFKVFKRPGVAGAVLQTASLLNNLFSDSLMVCGNIFTA